MAASRVQLMRGEKFVGRCGIWDLIRRGKDYFVVYVGNPVSYDINLRHWEMEDLIAHIEIRNWSTSSTINELKTIFEHYKKITSK